MRKNTSRVKQLISRCGGCRKEIKGIVGFSILFKCVKLSNPPELAKIKSRFKPLVSSAPSRCIKRMAVCEKQGSFK